MALKCLRTEGVVQELSQKPAFKDLGFDGVADTLSALGKIYFTAALLLLYCCFTDGVADTLSAFGKPFFTAALLLLYCCFTAAYLTDLPTLSLPQASPRRRLQSL